MLIIAVDFDGTLALGNKSHITASEPNYQLIKRLKDLKQITQCYIKIVTARGSKNKLSLQQKQEKYSYLIEEFCKKYEIPYDEISYNKEYAHLYIDDMSISEHDTFYGYNSPFTNNKILHTHSSVIKNCSTSLLEREWYDIASHVVETPKVLFCNDELIITEKIPSDSEPTISDVLSILDKFKKNTIKNFNFETYTNNIICPEKASVKTQKILQSLPPHNPTFFHGDLSLSNILKYKNKIYLIDPNYKYIFGSYLTDAGKAVFSYIAYKYDYNSAKIIIDKYGKRVLCFAVAEGCRVCKYKSQYISIVNNIAELL